MPIFVQYIANQKKYQDPQAKTAEYSIAHALCFEFLFFLARPIDKDGIKKYNKAKYVGGLDRDGHD